MAEKEWQPCRYCEGTGEGIPGPGGTVGEGKDYQFQVPKGREECAYCHGSGMVSRTKRAGRACPSYFGLGRGPEVLCANCLKPRREHANVGDDFNPCPDCKGAGCSKCGESGVISNWMMREGGFEPGPDQGEVEEKFDPSHLEKDHGVSLKDVEESGLSAEAWHEGLHSERFDEQSAHYHVPGTIWERHKPTMEYVSDIGTGSYYIPHCKCGWSSNIRSDQAAAGAWARHVNTLNEKGRKEKAGPPTPERHHPDVPVPKRHAAVGFQECWNCDGTGDFKGESCWKCHGSGLDYDIGEGYCTKHNDSYHHTVPGEKPTCFQGTPNDPCEWEKTATVKVADWDDDDEEDYEDQPEDGDYVIDDDKVHEDGNVLAEGDGYMANKRDIAFQVGGRGSNTFSPEPWKDCKKCENNGYLDCEKCKGTGAAEGSNWRACNNCKATGQIGDGANCAWCKGSGLRHDENCEKCDGSGRQHDNEGNELACPDCDGAAELPTTSDDIHKQISKHMDKEGYFPNVWHGTSLEHQPNFELCNHGSKLGKVADMEYETCQACQSSGVAYGEGYHQCKLCANDKEQFLDEGGRCMGCKGTGMMRNTTKCPNCNGWGMAKKAGMPELAKDPKDLVECPHCYGDGSCDKAHSFEDRAERGMYSDPPVETNCVNGMCQFCMGSGLAERYDAEWLRSVREIPKEAHGDNDHEWSDYTDEGGPGEATHSEDGKDGNHYHDWEDEEGNGWDVEHDDYLINTTKFRDDGNDVAAKHESYGDTSGKGGHELAWQHENPGGFEAEPWKDCKACKGSGYKACDNCKGSGTQEAKWKACGGCGGSGIKNIDAKFEGCSSCNSSGIWADDTCEKCNGVGYADGEDEECKTCEGKGALHSSLKDVHNQIYEHQHDTGNFSTMWHYKDYGALDDAKPCHGDECDATYADWAKDYHKDKRLPCKECGHDKESLGKLGSWMDQVTAPYTQEAVADPKEDIEPVLPALYEEGISRWPDDIEGWKAPKHPVDVFGNPKTGQYVNQNPTPIPRDLESCSMCDGTGACSATHQFSHPEFNTPVDIECNGHCTFCAGSGIMTGKDVRKLKAMYQITEKVADLYVRQQGVNEFHIWPESEAETTFCGKPLPAKGQGEFWNDTPPHKYVCKECWNNQAEHISDQMREEREDDMAKSKTDWWDRTVAKQADVVRQCVRCLKPFDVSEGGEPTGFCGECREQEGMVTHHTWSEESQKGHYGTTAAFEPCNRCRGTGTWGDPSEGPCSCERPPPQRGEFKDCPNCGHDEAIHGGRCENGNTCPRCSGSGLMDTPRIRSPLAGGAISA